jgi:hypothetical protein
MNVFRSETLHYNFKIIFTALLSIIREKTESPKYAQNDKIENVAGSA